MHTSKDFSISVLKIHESWHLTSLSEHVPSLDSFIQIVVTNITRGDKLALREGWRIRCGMLLECQSTCSPLHIGMQPPTLKHYHGLQVERNSLKPIHPGQ